MPDRTGDPATSRWTSASGSSADGTRCSQDADASRASRHEERLEPLDRRIELVTLDRAGRVDMLRTHLRALPHERAAPDALVLREDLEPLGRTLVAPIEVVALREGNGGRTDELRIQAVDGAGGIAQHAVDAHAVLLVLLQFPRRLPVRSAGQRLLVVLFADDPGFHAG